MTIHFVNLVSWKYFLDVNLDCREIHIDSISLQILTFCLTGKIKKRKSGISGLKMLKGKNYVSVYFLFVIKLIRFCQKRIIIIIVIITLVFLINEMRF